MSRENCEKLLKMWQKSIGTEKLGKNSEYL